MAAPSPSQTTWLARFPGCHLAVGFGFLLLGSEAKQALPSEIGASPFIQFPCAFFSAVLFPLGAFLALRTALVANHRRRTNLLLHFLGMTFVVGLLAVYFYFFILLSKTQYVLLRPPDFSARIMEAPRTASTEARRIYVAKYIYQLYGATSAYRLDDGTVAYYVPVAEDQTKWQEQQRLNRKIEGTRVFLERTTTQFSYLFGLYAGTFLATYFIGSLMLFRKSAFPSPPTSS